MVLSIAAGLAVTRSAQVLYEIGAMGGRIEQCPGMGASRGGMQGAYYVREDGMRSSGLLTNSLQGCMRYCLAQHLEQQAMYQFCSCLLSGFPTAGHVSVWQLFFWFSSTDHACALHHSCVTSAGKELEFYVKKMQKKKSGGKS
jgi:hypothetical protein